MASLVPSAGTVAREDTGLAPTSVVADDSVREIMAALSGSIVGGAVGATIGYAAWKDHRFVGAIAGWFVGSFVVSRAAMAADDALLGE